MKDNSNENISVSFIIEPVHQNNKRKDTRSECVMTSNNEL